MIKNFGCRSEDFTSVFELRQQKERMVMRKVLCDEQKEVSSLPQNEKFECSQNQGLVVEDKTLRKHRTSWPGLVQHE